ncbi:MAG: hypothetical protein V8T86_11250 [Victivallis sp.]
MEKTACHCFHRSDFSFSELNHSLLCFHRNAYFVFTIFIAANPAAELLGGNRNDADLALRLAELTVPSQSAKA